MSVSITPCGILNDNQANSELTAPLFSYLNNQINQTVLAAGYSQDYVSSHSQQIFNLTNFVQVWRPMFVPPIQANLTIKALLRLAQI